MPNGRKVLLAVLATVLVLAPSALASGSGQTRQLQAVQAQARNLQKKIHKSETVINFYNHKGRWALHLPGTKHGKKSCKDVVGKKRQKVCDHARRTLVHHTRRLKRNKELMLEAVATYAENRLVASGHAGSPLRSEMLGIVRASAQEDMSPFLVLSISGKESTLGRNTCGKNAWGWNRCSTNGWRSFAEGAREVARGLRVKYIGQWGSDTIAEIGYDYCGSTCYDWASHVSYFMSRIFNAGSGLRWQDAVNTVSGK